MTTSTLYSDIPTNFDVHPVKEDLVLLSNEAAVKRSIRNLLLTDPYERMFNPTIGAGIRRSLFENMGQDTEFILAEKIKEVINNHEPRANVFNVSIKALHDENAYSATIVFSIVNRLAPITLDLILRRVR